MRDEFERVIGRFIALVVIVGLLALIGCIVLYGVFRAVF